MSPAQTFSGATAVELPGCALSGRVLIGRAAFDRVTMAEAVRRIVEMATQKGIASHVCTGNLDHLAMMEHHPNAAEFRHAYETSSLNLADGMPVVWLSRLGHPASEHLPERIAGSDLVWELARVSAESGLRLFLLGGLPGSAEAAAAALAECYPGAVVCGTYCPAAETFDTPEEQEAIRAIVRDAAPDILLVALGAPKQERWIVANKAALGVPVSIGVGGSFEMACGKVKRAPRWARQTGFEWLCRLCQEPGRLAGRYLGRDLPFLAALVWRQLRAALHPARAGKTPRIGIQEGSQNAQSKSMVT